MNRTAIPFLQWLHLLALISLLQTLQTVGTNVVLVLQISIAFVPFLCFFVSYFLCFMTKSFSLDLSFFYLLSFTKCGNFFIPSQNKRRKDSDMTMPKKARRSVSDGSNLRHSLL